MKASDILSIAGQRLDDVAEPYLYPMEDRMVWLAEAESEAAVRASLLYDDSSTFTYVPLGPDQDSYRLDQRIDRIDSAYYLSADSSRPRAVDLTGPDAIAEARVGRCGPTNGRVSMVAHVGGRLSVWPTPTSSQSGTIRLAVYRRPLKPITKMDECPEIPEHHHQGLVDWILYRAYSTKDSELYDPKRADRALGDFIANFGERPDADTKRRQNERRRVTTRYPGP